MREHLKHRPGQAHRMQRGNAHDDVAHVADAGIADDVFQVFLGDGRDCSIDHVDGAQYNQNRHPVGRALRQQHHAHPDDTEGAQLHQHTGVQHANAGGSRHVTVGRPGMEGPQTGQNAKANHEQREYPVLEGFIEQASLRHLTQQGDRESGESCVGRLGVQSQDADPDQDAATHQVQHQLHCTVLFGAQKAAEVGAAAPNADQQVHGQHGQLVEEEQEEQVLCHKYAEHPRPQRQQQDEKVARAVNYGLGNQHRAKKHYAVEQNQGSCNSVKPQRQVDVQRRTQPGQFSGELKSAGGVVVPEEDGYR